MKMIRLGFLLLWNNVGFLECLVVLIIYIGSGKFVLQLKKTCNVVM
jgi:hypothetical protein